MILLTGSIAKRFGISQYLLLSEVGMVRAGVSYRWIDGGRAVDYLWTLFYLPTLAVVVQRGPLMTRVACPRCRRLTHIDEMILIDDAEHYVGWRCAFCVEDQRIREP